MPPLYVLCLLLGVTLAAVVLDRAKRRREQQVFRRLAIAHEMHYSPGDPLRLTPRVAAAWPVPGAAALRVLDLMYRTDATGHHYVFTAEYTLGVVRGKMRVRRVGAVSEPRSVPAGTAYAVRLAAAEAGLVEQYESLLG